VSLFSVPCDNEECSNEISFTVQTRGEKDYIKIVCVECGWINNISLVRVLKSNARRF